jgi:hypothetical protein
MAVLSLLVALQIKNRAKDVPTIIEGQDWVTSGPKDCDCLGGENHFPFTISVTPGA